MLTLFLSLDEKRRKTQTELDSQLAEANQLAKEIGQLFKTGKAQEAQGLKERSAVSKTNTKGVTRRNAKFRKKHFRTALSNP